jgi:hypothetical protein
MKKVLLLAVALLGSSLVWARSNSDPVTELTALLNNFLAAASHTPPSAADKATFNQFFDDDVIYTRAVGLVITKQDIMKSLDEPPSPGDPVATYSAEDITIHAYGNTAILAFTLVQKLPDTSTKRFRNTGTFMNRNHGWRAVAWQATSVAVAKNEETKK